MNESWRSSQYRPPAPGGGSNKHSDCVNATGAVGGNQWYRFGGAGGDALPLHPVNAGQCGTGDTGWLTGWASKACNSSGDCSDCSVCSDCKWGCSSQCVAGKCASPPETNFVAGHYPSMAEGVVEMWACFDYLSLVGGQRQCFSSVAIGVVRWAPEFGGRKWVLRVRDWPSQNGVFGID